MNILNVWVQRLRGLFGKRQMEQDLEDEFQFHFEKEVELHMSRGTSLEEARAAARKRFGGADRAKEIYRESASIPLLENFIRDLRQAARMSWKNPGFSAVAIVSLALGIGMNTAVFTIMSAAVLKDLPVKEPDRMARISRTIKGRSGEFSYPLFQEMSQHQSSFTEMSVSGGVRLSHVVYDGAELQELERISGLLVSPNYFGMLGVNAALGRVFTDSRETGADEVAVLRYGFWQTKLGANPSVIGKKLVVNHVPLTILGIATPAFSGDQVGRMQDIWVPISMQPRLDGRNLLESRTASFFRTLGRLKPGVSKPQAEGDLTRLYQGLLDAENEAATGTLINRPKPEDARVVILTGQDASNPSRERLIQPFQILATVVCVVLLIACCNVANLQLARNAARRHEFNTRFALGSSRGRLAVQLLTESLLLGMCGAAVGIVFAQFATRLLVQTTADVFYLTLDLQPDVQVLTFTLVMGLLTSLLTGLLPAIQSSSAKSDGLRNDLGRFRQRTNHALVVGQVALSVALLIGGGLLLRSVSNLRSADLGVDRSHITTVELSPEPELKLEEFPALQRALSERLRALPQAKAVTFSSLGLFARGGLTAPVQVPSSKVASEDRQMNMGYASPGFFEAMGMKLSRGRDFAEQDTLPTAHVGIISEAAAHSYFGERSPIGETIYFPGLDDRGRYIPFSEGLAKARFYQIIGVVQDAFDRGPRETPAHRIYLPLEPDRRFASTLYIRTAGDPADLTPGLMQTMREFAKQFRVTDVLSLEEQLNQNYAFETLGSRILTLFGILSLVLAAVGLYGVLNYSVNRRTAEIGVRMALGAQRSRVLVMVVREAAFLVVEGIAIGIPIALVSTRALQSLLYGLTPDDPVTIVMVGVILLSVGIGSASIPALRASRIDPLAALRQD